MHEMRETRKEGEWKGGRQERRDAGNEGLGQRRMQERRDREKEGCRKVEIHETRDAGKEGFIKGGIKPLARTEHQKVSSGLSSSFVKCD